MNLAFRWQACMVRLQPKGLRLGGFPNGFPSGARPPKEVKMRLGLDHPTSIPSDNEKVQEGSLSIFHRHLARGC
jgi:hypothetical protein